jgi:ABC-type uncharacterized transport system ATPase subunit
MFLTWIHERRCLAVTRASPMISIQVKQLTKQFGPVVALHGLDLTIAPGELFFLLGPNCSGRAAAGKPRCGGAWPASISPSRAGFYSATRT